MNGLVSELQVMIACLVLTIILSQGWLIRGTVPNESIATNFPLILTQTVFGTV
jgi:hypothetical protein